MLQNVQKIISLPKEKTVEEAIANLTEALQLYFEDDANIIDHPQTLVTTLEVSI